MMEKANLFVDAKKEEFIITTQEQVDRAKAINANARAATESRHY